MTEAMMKPDDELAERLDRVRYHTLRLIHPEWIAVCDRAERVALLDVATGSRSMSVSDALGVLKGYRSFTTIWVGIDDDTLLDDLAVWIERCAKPPFDPAPVVEGLIADIERVTRGRLGGLSEGERERVAIELGATFASDPYCQAAYWAVRSFNRDRG